MVDMMMKISFSIQVDVSLVTKLDLIIHNNDRDWFIISSFGINFVQKLLGVLQSFLLSL